MSGKFEVEGLRELDKQLGSLGAAGATTVLKAAVRKALQPAANQARAVLRGMRKGSAKPHKTYLGNIVQPGYASRSVRIKVVASRKTGMVTGMLGVRKEAFYATQFVELGVPAYGIAARPWLVPSFESNRTKMLNTFRDQLAQSIAKAAAKQALRRSTR